MPSGRLCLHTKAAVLRVLMRIGMILHGYPFPMPPKPRFIKTLPAIEPGSPSVPLYFYTPDNYDTTIKSGQRFPVVVNFHGGGFSIGRASDDARWARTVVERTNAVVVSVGYRLAPEDPFPAAVEDGVRTLLYLEYRARDLHLDISRVCISGFSAGGNLAFTVPLLYQALTSSPPSPPSILGAFDSSSPSITPMTQTSSYDFSTSVPLLPADRAHDSSHTALSDHLRNRYLHRHYHHPDDQSHSQPNHSQPNHPHLPSTSTKLRIISIISWYPILDYVLPRNIRRDRSIIPAKTLPPCLTNLFDESYIPKQCDRSSPFASPLHTTNAMLAEALPSDISIFMCEWDMLLREGQEFVSKLTESGKTVRSMMIDQSTHGWDKSPNPFRDQGSIDVHYKVAAEQMRVVIEKSGKGGE